VVVGEREDDYRGRAIFGDEEGDSLFQRSSVMRDDRLERDLLMSKEAEV